jgi:hypothetical protein
MEILRTATYKWTASELERADMKAQAAWQVRTLGGLRGVRISGSFDGFLPAPLGYFVSYWR